MPTILHIEDDPANRLLVRKLLTAGGPVYGFVTRARWVNIDTPAALEAADLTLRSAPFRF